MLTDESERYLERLGRDIQRAQAGDGNAQDRLIALVRRRKSTGFPELDEAVKKGRAILEIEERARKGDKSVIPETGYPLCSS